MAVSKYQNPAAYWQDRLSHDFSLTGAGYAGLGPNYNRILYRQRLERLSIAFAAAGCVVSGVDMLEVGCGTGFYTSWAQRQGVTSYTGLDITAVSVRELGRHFPAYTFVQADASAETLPVQRNFDLVLIADVLFHIVDDQRFERALRNLAQVVRPGGTLALSDVITGETHSAAAHVRHRSYATYKQLLTAQGLEITAFEPVFATLQPPSPFPSTSASWRLYELIWRYGLYRFGRTAWFDRTVPGLLAALDDKLMLKRASVATPNTKWMIFRRHAA